MCVSHTAIITILQCDKVTGDGKPVLAGSSIDGLHIRSCLNEVGQTFEVLYKIVLEQKVESLILSFTTFCYLFSCMQVIWDENDF